jgi:hemerythrin
MHKELVRWDESLSTGIETFDEQHKKIFNELNRLFNAIVERHSNEIVGSIIQSLYNYTNTHFKDEELEMREAEYYGYSGHKLQHEYFLFRIKEFQLKYDSGDDITVELFGFLKDWITNHILKEDKKYIPFLSRAGVA